MTVGGFSTIVAILAYLVPILLGFLLLYWVVRKAVRDGIRDARQNDADRA